MASNHYVNNADFLAAIKEYKEQVRVAAELGDEKPRLSNYIGECILKIATHLSYKPNFINYTFKDEMISDGIENCLQYIDNFDPTKSSNPFSYFTQIIFYAFIRRIQKEGKQTLIKGKMVQEMSIDFSTMQEHDEDGVFTSSYIDFVNTHGVYNSALEKEERRKEKKAKKQATLDDIIE